MGEAIRQISSVRWIQVLSYLSYLVLKQNVPIAAKFESLNKLSSFRLADERKIGRIISNGAYRLSGLVAVFLGKYLDIHVNAPIALLLNSEQIITDVTKLNDYVHKISFDGTISKRDLFSIHCRANSFYCNHDIYEAFNTFSKIIFINNYGIQGDKLNALSRVYNAMIMLSTNGKNPDSFELIRSAKHLSLRLRDKCARYLIWAWIQYLDLVFIDQSSIQTNLDKISVKIADGLELCSKINNYIPEKNYLIGNFEYYRFVMGVRFESNRSKLKQFQRISDCYKRALEVNSDNNYLTFVNPYIIDDNRLQSEIVTQIYYSLTFPT